MAKVTPDQAAADWAARLAASGDKITRGVQAVTTPPGQAAARQKSVYTQNVQANAEKWARNVAAVSTGEWQQATIEKGIPRVGEGARVAQPKVAAFLGQLLPHIDAGKAKLAPRGTYEQNKARASTWMDHMHSFKRR